MLPGQHACEPRWHRELLVVVQLFAEPIVSADAGGCCPWQRQVGGQPHHHVGQPRRAPVQRWPLHVKHRHVI